MPVVTLTHHRLVLSVVVAAQIILILLIGLAPGSPDHSLSTEHRRSGAVTAVARGESADQARTD